MIKSFQPSCWSRKPRLLRKMAHAPSKRGNRNKETMISSLLSASLIISIIDRTSLVFIDRSSPNALLTGEGREVVTIPVKQLVRILLGFSF